MKMVVSQQIQVWEVISHGIRRRIKRQCLSIVKLLSKYLEKRCNVYFIYLCEVTITLILIGVVSVIAINVNHMTVNIENSLNIYVKVDRAATDEQSKAVGDEINKLTGIKKVNYSSKDKELNKLIASQDKNSKQLFENYRTDNPLGDAYIVEVKNAKNLDKIAKERLVIFLV